MPTPPFTSPWNASNAIVSVAHTVIGTYIALSNSSPSLTETFLYDMDRKIWLDSSMGAMAFTEDLYAGNLAFFFGDNSGNIYQGFTSQANNYSNAPKIQTCFFTPPGTERNDWKQFELMHLYGTDGTLSVTVASDDNAPITLSKITDTNNQFQQGGDDIIYRDIGGNVNGRLFQITITWPVNGASGLSGFSGQWSFQTEPQAQGATI